MAIEYLEIRNSNRVLIGIIDTAISVIWRSTYFGVGDFEIYAHATKEHLNLLKVGNYVTRNDNIFVGRIEAWNVTNSVQDGDVIVATGRFAKSLLELRLVQPHVPVFPNNHFYPKYLKGNVARQISMLVDENLASAGDPRRRIDFVGIDSNNDLPEEIEDIKQTSYANLLEYTEEVLREYGLGARMYLDQNSLKLFYQVYKGKNRSINNTDGNEPVVFSEEFDNISSSNYIYDTKNKRNVALIGGVGEGYERFYSITGTHLSGINRREVFIDASSVVRELGEEELQNLYPSGVFDDIYFKVGGIEYATLVIPDNVEISKSSLQELFPTGLFNDVNQFILNGELIATEIFAKPDQYMLTPIGYRKKLDKENEKGTYSYQGSRYDAMLRAEGKKQLKPMEIVETLTGTINVNVSNWALNRDFFLGDIVTIQDNKLNKYADVRIKEITEVQDANGYQVDVLYGNDYEENEVI